MEDTKRTWNKKVTMKHIHAFEMFEDIEKAENDVKVHLLKEYGSKSPLNFLLSLNFRHDIKLDLPEGMPPLDPKDMDAVSHPDFSGNLSSNIHRLKNCMTGSKLPIFKKEDIFIQVLLACPLKDAEILCFAKDHALEEMYPSITAELVSTVFPAYVNKPQPMTVQPKAVKKQNDFKYY